MCEKYVIPKYLTISIYVRNMTWCIKYLTANNKLVLMILGFTLFEIITHTLIHVNA